MSIKVNYRITETGQIIRCTTNEQLVINPDAILSQLLSDTEKPKETSADNAVRCLYHLGDGVSAFRQKIGSHILYWNSIQLECIPFLTAWQIEQDPAVNGGKHYIRPWDSATSEIISIGAPLVMPVPDDLIIHFHVEFQRNPADPDIQLPPASRFSGAAAELTRGMSNFYLTCFSLSRNTCVYLPLPNLYPDCHLCTGDAFRRESVFAPEKHAGLVNSMRTYVKAWADTTWNRDLLGGPRSRKSAQYARFIRFDASSGAPLPFSGCADWDIAASPVPLEDVYRPWTREGGAVRTVIRDEDAQGHAEAVRAGGGAV